ncbi:MAG: acetyl-CoA carboxylase biotin carboxyl carrier protein [Acidobacteria bacterium]|nr:acetyl-CoA carboxylase biotin carboxyl carrier protein [Acidobacteriota bacterium]
MRELIELVSEKGFTKFQLQKGEFKLKISTSINQKTIPTPKPKVETIKTALVSTTAVEQSVVSPPQNNEVKLEKELYKVKSPIVGTFYCAPSPTADPFVKVGSQIKQGTVLCIIEAMKLMNEIESDVVGEIVEIYVENSHPVEYGQALFGVKVN